MDPARMIVALACVTAPPVTLAIRSARSSEGRSPSQSCVTRPGEISTARAKSARVDFDCFSQAASCMS